MLVTAVLLSGDPSTRQVEEEIELPSISLTHSLVSNTTKILAHATVVLSLPGEEPHQLLGEYGLWKAHKSDEKH